MKRVKQILAVARPFLRPLIIAVVLTGGLTLIGMAPPLLMRRLINDVAREGNWGIFPLVMALLFAVPVLRAVVNVANSLTLNGINLGIIRRLRRRMFRHLMRLSMRFYGQTPVGGINQRLMGDVGTVSGLLTGGLISLLTDIIAVGFAVSVMLGLSWKLSVLTFALLPLYYLNYRFFSRRIRQTTAQLRTHMDHVSATLQERLSAHELIQSYGQEKEELTHFSSRARQIMDSAVRGSTYNISFNQLSAFINKIGNTAIYCAGCYYFIKGSMGYGDVVAFCAYATQILGPVVRFANVANQFVQAGVSLDRINEIMDREPAIKEEPDARPVETLLGDIEVDGVTFQYTEGQPALKDVHLSIPAGTHVAVAGPPGAGRSTLAMLLRRFYDPDEGRIDVDGEDIRRYRLRDYRAALAMVLPESAIFDGTIRENLLYGKPDATDDRMQEVARAVGLDEFVEDLADGYETRVGTGGLKLSTGVRQQIGVARALLSDPGALIVDEATAVLDPESAANVNDAIRAAMEGRTCIIIVHRLLMARDADRVVVMEDGTVEQAGTHEELVRQPKSLYRRIFSRQYGEDRLPPVAAEED
ncbi:MAG: ABC transporter ATP-binding protein [Candidatus Brocadiia bacterium]